MAELEATRLELREALEREAAIGDVLRTMSGSASGLQPVLRTVIEKATRLCGAKIGFVYIRAGDVYRLAEGWAPPDVEPKWREARGYIERNPVRSDDTGVVARVHRAAAAVMIRDVAADPDYPKGPLSFFPDPHITLLGVPLMKDGVVIGVLSIAAAGVRPFADRQIDLVRTFADQAVIAIENARLYATIERQRAEMRRFLSPQVAELITSPEGEALLKGHRREITVAFCDLRGFTAFSETAEPEEALAVVRTYHETLGPLIVEHGGTLEHFEGDGAMVYFNDPVQIEAPVLQAVRMTLAMRDRMAGISAQWLRRGYDLGFGCGVATGYATLGRIGFEGRYDYGAIGPVTNLAARLSSDAKAGQILLSQRAFAAIEDLVEAEPMGEIEVKGYSRPQLAYNVLGLKAPVGTQA